MSIKRYNLESDFGVPYMDEEPTGDWVRLDDVVKMLKSKLTGIDNGLTYCYECGYWDDLFPDIEKLIKGEHK